ncbi:MAG: hypothetical protein RIR00_1512 [Pseudomonadota bacterium]|jgi:SAM-dependent methyltransferase
MRPLPAAFVEPCECLFSTAVSFGEQREAAHALFAWFSGILGFDDAQPDAVTQKDYFLPNGKAISYQGAARCLWEFARSSKFLRGVEAAIRAAQQRFPGERIRVLDVGCGPFALLVLPMVLRFTAEEVEISLLDINPESLAAAQRLIAELGVEAWFRDFHQGDATTWQATPAWRPQVIVAEVLQNALKREPQVAVTRHLAPQLEPGGFFVPECIALDLVASRWMGESCESGCEQMTSLAPLFALSVATLDQTGSGRVTLPATLPDNTRLAIRTAIRVFGDIELGQNECSLTCNFMPRDLRGLSGGQVLDYDYDAGAEPGLRFRVSDQPAA